MKDHREFTEMERLMNALSVRLESSQDLQVMFHNYKGSRDVVSAMETMVNGLIDFRVGNDWIEISDGLILFGDMTEEDVLLYPDFSGEPIVGCFVSDTNGFEDGDGRKVEPTHYKIINLPKKKAEQSDL